MIPQTKLDDLPLAALFIQKAYYSNLDYYGNKHSDYGFGKQVPELSTVETEESGSKENLSEFFQGNLLEGIVETDDEMYVMQVLVMMPFYPHPRSVFMSHLQAAGFEERWPVWSMLHKIHYTLWSIVPSNDGLKTPQSTVCMHFDQPLQSHLHLKRVKTSKAYMLLEEPWFLEGQNTDPSLGHPAFVLTVKQYSKIEMDHKILDDAIEDHMDWGHPVHLGVDKDDTAVKYDSWHKAGMFEIDYVYGLNQVLVKIGLVGNVSYVPVTDNLEEVQYVFDEHVE